MRPTKSLKILPRQISKIGSSPTAGNSGWTLLQLAIAHDLSKNAAPPCQGAKVVGEPCLALHTELQSP